MFQFELKYSGTKYSYMYLYNQTGYKFMLVLFARSTKILCIVIAFIIWLTCPPPKALWFYEKKYFTIHISLTCFPIKIFLYFPPIYSKA